MSGKKTSEHECQTIEECEISKRLLMAASSSAFAEFLTFPIDTIKVYLQLQTKPHGVRSKIEYEVGSWSAGMKMGHSHHLARLPIERLRKSMHEIYVNHGIRGYYRGYKPAIIRASLNNALSATLYKPVRTMLGARDRDCPFYIKIAAGFLTGAATQTIAAPTDLLKVRMQADSVRTYPRYSGFRDAIKQIYSRGGIRVFWKGVVPSMFRAGFSVAATLGTYDQCKSFFLSHQIFKKKIINNPKDPRLHLLCSLCSGLCATLLACPFDVVKTRYQAQSFTNPIYKSSRDCLKQILHTDGISVLFRGFAPMYARLGPWQISFFLMFEFLHDKVLDTSF